jgi:protein-S-isoprenylcysteine O-methyltransferase Ste14
MIEAAPFLLAVAAGFVGAVSAVLLRRASPVLGSLLLDLSYLIDLIAAVAMLWALAWAWGIESAAGERSWITVALGWLLALTGGALAGWGTRRRGLGPLRRWSSARFETPAPYRWIRRPIQLGLMLLAGGLALLRGSAAMGVWWAGLVVAWNLALELGDWELRHRLPAGRDYLRRTPRFLPRWGFWRPT